MNPGVAFLLVHGDFPLTKMLFNVETGHDLAVWARLLENVQCVLPVLPCGQGCNPYSILENMVKRSLGLRAVPYNTAPSPGRPRHHAHRRRGRTCTLAAATPALLPPPC